MISRPYALFSFHCVIMSLPIFPLCHSILLCYPVICVLLFLPFPVCFYTLDVHYKPSEKRAMRTNLGGRLMGGGREAPKAATALAALLSALHCGSAVPSAPRPPPPTVRISAHPSAPSRHGAPL
jgi:hypothetical protein